LSEIKDVGAARGTPWGDASELRQQRLYPGAGTPPEEVSRNQRERLFAAMVAVVSEKGYEATTVADVLALSGVSRSAFYRHFADKSECLTATACVLFELAAQALAPTGADDPREPKEIFEEFLELLASQPAAARLCFVELHAAGPEAERAADHAFESAVAALATAIGDRPEPTGPSPELLGPLLAGVRKLIHTRLSRDEAAQLADLGPGLWQWMADVAPPAETLEAPRRQRAPQALFEGYTPGERIARAVAAVIAEKGYRETSTDDIAARASISLSTFYAHFGDKRDAVLGVLEMSGAQITALAVPAARRAAGWPEGVRALYEAICAYFVAEPAMADLALVGVYRAGAQACRRRDRVIDPLTEMLVGPGLAENPGAAPISSEAIGATVYALMREQLRREGPESLGAVVPLATYISLVGFVGPERALAVANEKGRRR